MKNVVLLTIDTLRSSVIGPNEEGRSLTPFIDSIKDKCIKFTNCKSIGPYTQASFPGILTSSYYLEHGKSKKLSPDKTVISEVVKRGGYTTAGFHSNPYLSDFFGWNRGWDKFYDSMEDEVPDMVPYILGDVINAKASEWLTSYTKQPDFRPFFLWAHYMDVHEPYVPERKYVDMIDPSISLSKEEMFAMFKDTLLPRDISDPEKVTLLKKLYEAHVFEVDEYTKVLFNKLEELGVLDNTIVIITSDHGDEFGEHGSLSHDGKMYSELIEVPLIIYDPDLQEGQTCDMLVSGVDVPPTIARLFGLEPPEEFHGSPLLPLDSYAGKYAFGEAIGKTGRKEKETDKPVYFYQEGSLRITWREENDAWEMYDLQKDPAEKENLIESSPDAASMKEKLKAAIPHK
jgi:arylsulfatase A-like enzyme